MSEHSNPSTSKQADLGDEEDFADEETSRISSPLLQSEKQEQEQERRQTSYLDRKTRYISNYISRYESSFLFEMTEKKNWTILEWMHFLGLTVISQVIVIRTLSIIGS